METVLCFFVLFSNFRLYIITFSVFFFPAYFLHRNCLWKPLQKMPTVVLNKGRGKLFRGEIWVECHCGILDLEADKGGLGWARRGFPLCQSRWHHYRMRGAPGLILWCFLVGCHSARNAFLIGMLWVAREVLDREPKESRHCQSWLDPFIPSAMLY